MDPQALRRRIAKSPPSVWSQKFGRIRHEPHTESSSHNADDDDPRPSEESPSPPITNGPVPTGGLELRAAARENQSVSRLHVVVENSAGKPVETVTLNGLPTAATVLAAPFGVVTLPSLHLQGNSVVGPTPIPSNSVTSPAATANGPLSALSSSVSSASTVATAAPAAGNATSSSSSSSSSLSSSSSSSTSASSLSSSHTSHPISTHNSTSHSHTTFKTSTSSSNTGFGVVATPTSGTGGAGGAASTGSAPTSTSTAAAAPAPAPHTPQIVGGVVGGVAAVAIVLTVILVLLKWYRRRSGAPRELRSNPETPQRPDTGRSADGPGMTENAWSAAGASGAAGAAAGVGASRDPFQDPPSRSERGFQKLGGRKLESVLVSGGDGYGEPGASRGSHGQPGTADTSFYRDSAGNYGGPASNTSSVNQGNAATRGSIPSTVSTMGPSIPPPVPERRNPGPFRDSPDEGSSPSPPPGLSTSPADDVVLVRPGPARQAVHTAGFRTPPQSPAPRGADKNPAARLRADPIGRSHPSFDGSRGSRGSKFAEDLE